jgi:hypothetical protein
MGMLLVFRNDGAAFRECMWIGADHSVIYETGHRDQRGTAHRLKRERLDVAGAKQRWPEYARRLETLDRIVEAAEHDATLDPRRP